MSNKFTSSDVSSPSRCIETADCRRRKEFARNEGGCGSLRKFNNWDTAFLSTLNDMQRLSNFLFQA